MMKKILAVSFAALSLCADAFIVTENHTISEAVKSYSGTISYSVYAPIETYMMDAFADTTIERFTVEVPKGKTATITVSQDGAGSWSFRTCVSDLLLSRGKDDFFVTSNTPRTIVMTANGVFSLRVTATPTGYWTGYGWQSGYHLNRRASASFPFRVDVEYSGNMIPAAPAPAAPAVTVKSDLLPYQPKGWAAPLTVAKAKKGASSKASAFKDTDTLYVNWAVKCANKDVTATFNNSLYVDGKLKRTWTHNGLQAEYFYSVSDIEIGNLSPGTHTIRISADTSNAVDESNEGNNSYTRTVTIEEDMSKYLINVSVSFLPGGGTGTMKAVSKKIDVSKPLSSYKFPACSFKRPGYVFAGWAIVYNACGEYLEPPVYPAGYEYKEFCGDLTLEARWEKDVLEMELGEGYTPGTIMHDSEFAFDLDIVSGSKPKVTAKGLPKGVKLESAEVTNVFYDVYTEEDHLEVKTVWYIHGVASLPGSFEVTLSATSATIKTPVIKTFYLNFQNITSPYLTGLDPEIGAYDLYAGVNAENVLDLETSGGYKVTAVSGLPTGLKFDSKKGTVSGVPTKAGAYTVTVTAKNGSLATSATVSMRVMPLPNWVQGTFTGFVEYDTGVECNGYGSATATVGADGKMTGKVFDGERSWTFSASSFEAIESPTIYTWDEHGEPYSYVDYSTTNFVARVTAKSGKISRICKVSVGVANAPEGLANGILYVYDDDDDDSSEALFPDVEMYRNLCKDKSSASTVASSLGELAAIYNCRLEGGWISVSVASNGDVKATGKLFDGTAITSTTTLLCDFDESGYGGWFFIIDLAPSGYNGGRFFEMVRIDETGAYSDKCSWFSMNPAAGSVYEAGFVRDAYMYGYRYDPSLTLNDMFDSPYLQVVDGGVQLAYMMKETTFDDDERRKLTNSYLSFVDSELCAGPNYDGIYFALNGAGNGFSVPKATKPVKNDDEWLYNGENDCALTLSFNKANGTVKGTYTYWFDYVSAYDDMTDKTTVVHTSKKVNFDGVVMWADWAGGDIYCVFPWETMGEYEDERTEKTKQYKYKAPGILSFTPPAEPIPEANN